MDPNSGTMSDLHIEICSTPAFAGGLHNSGVDSTGGDLSNWHDDSKLPPSVTFSGGSANMSPEAADSIANSTAPELQLLNSIEEAEGPLTAPYRDEYTCERLSDPVGKIHRGTAYQDPLDTSHASKRGDSRLAGQGQVPRYTYVPELAEVYRSMAVPRAVADIIPEISRTGQRSDLQHVNTPIGSDAIPIHGVDASESCPMTKLQVWIFTISYVVNT
jgi:hypothetical protein